MKVTATVALAAAFFLSGCSNCCPQAHPPTPIPTPTVRPTPTSSQAPTNGQVPTPSPTPASTVRPTPALSPGPVAGGPGVCAEADLLFDPTLNELLLINCTTYSGGPKTLTVWGWDGGTWHVVTSGPAPARVVGGAALDTATGVITVYGGYVPDVDPCNTETWQWDRASWSQVNAEPPPACSHMKMIFDAGTEQTLLMGGQDGRNLPVDETWAWTGSAWEQVNALLPPSRAHFGLAYDPEHEHVLLYGGLTRTAVLGDFWSYQDGQWQSLVPLTDPGPVSHVAMAYDTTTGGLLLFGGATGNDTFGTLTDDTWLLTDGAWQHLHPDTTPGKRGSASLGYDPSRHLVVLYGGFDATGSELDDTWLWDGRNWSCAANCR